MEGRGGGDEVEPDEYRDAHEVVRHGHPGRGAEPATDIEKRSGDADDAVEEDLGNEPAQQRRGDGAMLTHDAQRLRRGGVMQEGVAVDDPRGEDPRDR